MFALLSGVLFALPRVKLDFVKVEINGVSIAAEVARSPRERSIGLSERPGLSALSGMIFLFDRPDKYGMWMKGMKFPIDILWIRGGTVVDLEENVSPPRRNVSETLFPVYRSEAPADVVLETAAGFSKRYNVKIGDQVKIFWSEAAPRVPRLGEQYFIETLAQNPAQGKDFKIEKLLYATPGYKKFLISYKSDQITVSGVMNIPSGAPPAGGWPVLILNHGLIHPSIYFPGRGSKREQDFFTRKGYATIHPDYRGYGITDSRLICRPTLFFDKDACRHDFYVGYSQDVVNLVDALKKLNSQLLDVGRIGLWGHSMGGGIAARVMVLSPDIRAYVLFAPISADAEDNFYELPQDELSRLAKVYGVGEDARKLYEKISPLNYFSLVEAPVQVHHGIADKEVPPEFSEKIFEELKAQGKVAEFFKYPGEGHEFGDAWSWAAERSLQFFDKYVKPR